MFTQSIKFYTSYCHSILYILKITDIWINVIDQIDKKLMVAPLSKFYGKIWFVFCLKIGKRFFLEVLF